MQNLGRISPCERDIWPRDRADYTEQIVNFTGSREQNLLPALNARKNHPSAS